MNPVVAHISARLSARKRAPDETRVPWGYRFVCGCEGLNAIALRLDHPNNAIVARTSTGGDAVQRTVGVDAYAADRIFPIVATGKVVQRRVYPTIASVRQLENVAEVVRATGIPSTVEIISGIHGEGDKRPL